jgi:hypothetical protein
VGVKTGIDRRGFLRNAGAAGFGVALAGRLTTAEARPDTRKMVVFRLSTRGLDACNACKGHGANRYFRTSKAANRIRAHAGCNCLIVTQEISKTRWNRYFRRKDGTLRKQWDVRWTA